MKKYLRILIIIHLVILNSAYSQIIKLDKIINNDTLWLPDAFIGNKLKIELDFSKLILCDSVYVKPHYLVIQLDSNTYINKNVSFSSLNTNIFWIDKLEKIITDEKYYYDDVLFSIIDEGHDRFINGEKNNLTLFLYYLQIFNNSVTTSKPKNTITYLYKANNSINTLNLYNQQIWEIKGNRGIKYIIFKTNFWAMPIFDKLNKLKILVPFSTLLEFEPIYNNLDGLTLTDEKDIIFFGNNFTRSNLVINIDRISNIFK